MDGLKLDKELVDQHVRLRGARPILGALVETGHRPGADHPGGGRGVTSGKIEALRQLHCDALPRASGSPYPLPADESPAGGSWDRETSGLKFGQRIRQCS